MEPTAFGRVWPRSLPGRALIGGRLGRGRVSILSELDDVLFPGSIAKGSSSKSGCQLHLPTSHANLSRGTSPANFSCQLVESYFTCQLRMPTCRELLNLPASHVNFLRVTSPANFSCQLFGCYLILLKAQANLSGVTSLS